DMQDKVAVLTTVRDDDWFLKKWVDYYGGFFGREALYVINHGNQESVREIAAGANLFAIPDTQRVAFNPLRWRTQNFLLSALRQWYDHVIVCDVDEFIVIDPASGDDLGSYMMKAKKRRVRTAIGLEVLHLPGQEKEGVETSILGPRRHAQLSHWYCKPCIISRRTKLSRGGHYCSWEGIELPEPLYLFHMKFCDFDLYADTLDRRNEMVRSMGVSDVKETTTNRQWFAEDRDDAALFAEFESREVEADWDFSAQRAQMKETYRYRSNDLYHFTLDPVEKLYKLPERFGGIV
ncbi:MAG: glycosyltransferase family 2 protein, partial [Sulfitobacter sp.]|nr:glycosyltransferase family 2 protein [Sulfitobacter sp.]